MSAQAWSSATSLMVKSNSLRATKSTAGRALQRAVGVDGDLGADQAGLQVRIDRLQRLDGLHVRRRRTASRYARRPGRSPWPAARRRRCAGRAAGRRSAWLFSTSAAGWASQVGYQKDLISRAPGSASRRRRRNRRTKGPAGRAYAAWDAPDQVGRRLSRPPGDLSRAPSPDATAGRTPAGNSWRGEAPAPVGQPLRSARRLSANCQVSRAGTPIAISRARFSNERASAVSAGRPNSGPSTA